MHEQQQINMIKNQCSNQGELNSTRVKVTINIESEWIRLSLRFKRKLNKYSSQFLNFLNSATLFKFKIPIFLNL